MKWKNLFHGEYLRISYTGFDGSGSSNIIKANVSRDAEEDSGLLTNCYQRDFESLASAKKGLIELRNKCSRHGQLIDEIDQAINNLEELYMYQGVSPLHADFFNESEKLFFGRTIRVVKLQDSKKSVFRYYLKTNFSYAEDLAEDSSSLNYILTKLNQLVKSDTDDSAEYDDCELEEIEECIRTLGDELSGCDSAEEASRRLANIVEKRPRCYGCHPDKDDRSSRCLICEHEHDCVRATANLANPKKTEIVNEDGSKMTMEIIKDRSNKNSTGDRKENKFMKQMENLFKDFYPSEVPSGEVAMTMYGQLAVRRKDGSYVRFNAATGQIENQMNLVVSSEKLDKMYILMPTAVQQLQVGDIIKEKDTYYQIIELAAQANKIKTANLSTSAESNLKIESNIITGQKMYRKVFSFLNMAQQNQGANPMMQQGMFNPMMLMMLDSAGGADDSMKMMAMMSMMPQMMGGQAGANPMMNPMMMYFMMGDSGSGDGTDWLKMMAMSSMMQQFGAIGNFTNPMMTPVAAAPEDQDENQGNGSTD